MILPNRARVLSLVFPLLIAACGGGGASGSATTTSQSPASSAPPVVKAVAVNLDGKSQTILVDAAKGMTLYYFAADKGANKVACTGGCLAVWPPMELDASTAPAGAGLKGTLGTITNPNGKPQLTYNGWPLYWYAKDKVPGDATGNNVGQKWFVATPDMAPNSASSY